MGSTTWLLLACPFITQRDNRRWFTGSKNGSGKVEKPIVVEDESTCKSPRQTSTGCRVWTGNRDCREDVPQIRAVKSPR